MASITSLEDLQDVLMACPGCMAGDDTLEHTCLAAGLPPAHAQAGCDWSNFPTFGGEDPMDTGAIWSWDETRLLVGSCAAELIIVDREDD